ncbi:MAG: 30S ribosomal protein S17e [Nanoarchaeota archaeon]
MGRIKTKRVKRVSLKLIAEHLEEFSEDFAKNKAMLNRLVIIRSPKVRNVIAGYLTRLKKMGPREE